jgi:hypothetical protein
MSLQCEPSSAGLLGDPHGQAVQARLTDGVLFLSWNLLLYLLLILLSISWSTPNPETLNSQSCLIQCIY